MKKNNGTKILIPIIALLISGVVVLLERYGVTYEYTKQEPVIKLEEKAEAVKTDTTCLILTADDDMSHEFEEMMAYVLEDMKIGYDTCQVDENFTADVLDRYDTAVITFSDWEVLGDEIAGLMKWVESALKETNILKEAIQIIKRSPMQRPFQSWLPTTISSKSTFATAARKSIFKTKRRTLSPISQ